MEQVVINLISNAAKYTDPRGCIWVSLAQNTDEAALRIRDNGKGISPELLPHLFKLFVQAEPGSRGGLGIGLNLVQRLVQLHGGKVYVNSAGAGCGSEFTVRIPRLASIAKTMQIIDAETNRAALCRFPHPISAPTPESSRALNSD
jgi:two-component system, chemotaxis family, CheB/CheR fusion protein